MERKDVGEAYRSTRDLLCPIHVALPDWLIVHPGCSVDPAKICQIIRLIHIFMQIFADALMRS